MGNLIADRLMANSANRVGILGGGQLGLMLGQAAHGLGLEVCFVDPSADACARQVGPVTVVPWDDHATIGAAFADCAVVTYEWEGVPAPLLDAIDVPVVPGKRSLQTSQDRLLEKQCFELLGIGTAPYRAVNDAESLSDAIHALGAPGILKTRSGGYDGKGQIRVPFGAGSLEANQAWNELQSPSIYERMIEFDFEFSIILVRDRNGDIATYDPIQNEHANGILRLSRLPAPLSHGVAAGARDAAVTLAEHLDHVGVLTLECFATPDGFLANEFAPRVHNSGHWSIEGAEASQFEQHLRAVIGLPLGETTTNAAAIAMRNCIGRMPDPSSIVAVSGATLHDYGKLPRTARKVGHVTVTATTEAELEHALRSLDACIQDDG